MSAPGRGTHEGRAAPYACYCKADAVRGAAKCDALMTGDLGDAISLRQTRGRRFYSLPLGKMSCPGLPWPVGRPGRALWHGGLRRTGCNVGQSRRLERYGRTGVDLVALGHACLTQPFKIS